MLYIVYLLVKTLAITNIKTFTNISFILANHILIYKLKLIIHYSCCVME
jgi:hypothetical protein